jgi:purine-binding chemotaxis protein CheW
VGAEEYAVPVAHVVEVAELGDVAPVPGSPTAVLGVRNLRGQVLPVFDLATLFGLVADGRPARVLVAEDRGRVAGLAVDEVTDVGLLAEAEALEEAGSELLVGSMLVAGTLVGVIDVAQLFAALDRQAA